MKDNKARIIVNLMLPLLVIIAMTAFLIGQIARFEAYAVDEAAGIPTEGEITVEEQVPETVKANTLDEPEALLELYMEEEASVIVEEAMMETVPAQNAEPPKSARYWKLNEAEKRAYLIIKERITEVASGEKNDTRITITFSDIFDEKTLNAKYSAGTLGLQTLTEGNTLTQDAQDALDAQYPFDTTKIFNAILRDCPKNLYWFDKTRGMGILTEPDLGYDIDPDTGELRIWLTGESEYTLILNVTGDYSDGAVTTYNINGITLKYNCTTDKNKTSAVTTAIENAAAIVAANSDGSDYEKLVTYANEICNAVTYNQKAVNENAPYGNPWQLIYVFDDDNTTNVVCEGYSKAFKYLCDLSIFDDSISCALVTGQMAGGTGAGGHMWNLITVNNANYLVDVTNCDEGTIGAPDKLFMKGNSSFETVQVEERETHRTADSEKYVFGNLGLTYTYDYETVTTFDESERRLAESNYFSCEHEWDEGVTTKAAKCKETGIKTSTCSKCNNTKEEIIPALGHNYQEVSGSAVEATCTASGKAADQKCSRCNDVQIGASIAALGHDYQEEAGSAKEAKCTEAGKEADKECSRCHDRIEGNVISAKGHTPAVATEENRVEATCEKDGSCDLVTKCSACNTEISRVTKTIKALGHNYGSWKTIKAATCTEAGSKSRVCSRDDSHKVTETIAAKGHSWDKGVVTTQPTTTAEGVKTFTCDSCKTTKTEKIAKLPPVKIAVPEGKTLTYNGKSQTGVAAGTGYTLSGAASATNAGSYTAKATLKAGYAWSDGSVGAKNISWKINKSVIKVTAPTGKSLVYNGKSQTGVADGSNYTLSGTKKATRTGTYTVKATLKTAANYTYKWKDNTTAAKSIKWTIKKAGNPLTIKAKTKNVGFAALKKKNQSFAATHVITTSKKGVGTVTYVKASGNKNITINKKTGAVTVKKGLKKGTYKIKVNVTAAGNVNYNKATKAVTFTIKVK